MKINIIYDDEAIHSYESDVVPRAGEILVIYFPDGTEEMFKVDSVGHELEYGSNGIGVQKGVDLFVDYEGAIDSDSDRDKWE